jgi:hypothetical protein
MKKVILFIAILFLICLISWSQPYEITEIDIFSLEILPNSKEITVYGISFKNSFKEALEKFGKNEEDISKKREYYFIDGLPKGMVIRSVDKNNINAIFLHEDFKINLKGKTSKYYDLKTDEEFQAYVTECFGSPDYIYKDSWGFGTHFYYLKGFEFYRIGKITFTIGLMSEEDIISKARESGAKKLEKIKEIKEEVYGWILTGLICPPSKCHPLS